MATFKQAKNNKYMKDGKLARAADVPENAKQVLEPGGEPVVVGHDGGLYDSEGNVLAMDAGTTQEQSQDESEEEDEQIATGFKKSEVLKRYNQGANYYQLAQEFYGFQSEEAVDTMRFLVESVTQPEEE